MAGWSGARLEWLGLGWGVGVRQGGGRFGGRWVGGRRGWWVGGLGRRVAVGGVGRFRSGAGCCRYSPVARFRIWACGYRLNGGSAAVVPGSVFTRGLLWGVGWGFVAGFVAVVAAGPL